MPLSREVGDAKKDGLGWGSLFQLKQVFLTFLHVLRVARLARELKVDIIHTNSLKADIIGGLAGRLADIPVVWHIRDRIDVDYLSKPVVVVFRLLSRIIPTFVIANSKATLATVKLEGRRPSAAIGSGVDLEKYTGSSGADEAPQSTALQPVGERRPELRIGLVGRISPWKGQHIFLKAAAEVLKKHPGTRFELIGAALFDEAEYERELHELCRSAEIEDAVKFTGFVNDVPARLATLDILVHASTTGEPYGQVIIEGMAAEKPVIATNGGGVPEIVLDGVTGILVPMGDSSQMAEAIEYLLDNPGVRKSMGRLGRARALDHFTVQKTARMVEEVYQRMLHPAAATWA
jgi:glycosyltransferase involved in cell wall biosynthesis